MGKMKNVTFSLDCDKTETETENEGGKFIFLV